MVTAKVVAVFTAERRIDPHDGSVLAVEDETEEEEAAEHEDDDDDPR